MFRRRVFRESVLILHVSLQQSLVDESFRTEPARVPRLRVLRGLFARVMRYQVHRQVLLVEIVLATMLATIQILIRMRVLVLQIFGLVKEALVAQLALETIILRVSATMAFQIGFLIGAILAEIADEHLQPGMDQFVASYVHRTTKRLIALVTAEGSIDIVKILQVLHEFSRMAKASSAFDALMHGARLTPSLPSFRIHV